MNRRSFVKKLVGWLAAIFIFVGLGGLVFRLWGEEEEVSPEKAEEHDLEVGEDRAKEEEQRKEEKEKAEHEEGR